MAPSPCGRRAASKAKVLARAGSARQQRPGMDAEGGRARRVRTPVQRMRSSMLATSDLAKARGRDEEAATRSQNPTPAGYINTVRGWAKGEVVWAVRSFEFPTRMPAGPWPARVAAATPAGSEFVTVKWLGGDDSEEVDADGVQEFLHCAEHVAHAKRSRAAAFQAAVAEAVSVAEGGGATAKRQLAVEMKVEGTKSREGAEVAAAQKRQRRDRAAGAAGGTPVKEEVKEEEPPVAAEEEQEVEEMSAYEKLRQANMNRNKQILDALELPNLPSFVHGETAMVTVKARGLKGTRKAPEELPTRERSLRVQGKGPDGSQLELPSDWREPIRFNPSSRKENGGAGRSSMSLNDEDYRRLRRTGDLTVADTVPRDRWAEDPEVALTASKAQAESLMRKLSDATDSTRGAAKASSLDPAGRGFWRDFKGAADSLRAVAELQVAEADVAKVCPQRIASIAFHPMENHVVVAAGDKSGNIGVFTPDWASDDSCVTVFDVHTSAVTWMAFDDTSNPHALYSSSYENIVRRLDVQQQVFSEVLQLEEDQYDFLSTCHLEAGGHVLRCGFGTGHMHIVDLRGGKPTTVHLHNKTIRSIDLSPGNSNLLLTGSIDHSARIWDIRKLRRSDSLAAVTHSQGVTQARFGRGSGSVAVTSSYDDTCKVLDVTTGNLLHTIRHNNSTGRWLSAFQAVFLPGSDSLCSIGSMEQHRGIDILDAGKGSRVARMTSQAYASITSVNAWHPTRQLLVGGNSSGKVYLWR